MKQALALTFLSSMICLSAWDAEAAPGSPHDSPEAPGAAHHGKAPTAHAQKAHHARHTQASKGHGKGSATRATPATTVAKVTKVTKVAKVAKESAPRASRKGEDHARKPTPGSVSLSGSTKADPGFSLDPSPKAEGHGAHKKAAKAETSPKKPVKHAYFLAADPHVPLALVDGGEIRSVGVPGKTCGMASRWAKPGSRWSMVDAWGQVTGTREIQSTALYDVTRCREVAFKGDEGKAPRGLFVSEDSDYTPVPKASWSPSEEERKRFEGFATSIEEMWVDKKPTGKVAALEKRSMFFHVPASPGAKDKRPTRWAVVGGPTLLMAYLGEHDHWKVASVEAPLGLADSYQPVAVLDMNGDGVPEVVYHSSDGPTFGESVLSFDRETMSWEESAVSPGGASL
jgi:hypothetical protein